MTLPKTDKTKSAPQAKNSWEERVMSLESLVSDRDTKLAAQAETIAAQAATVEGLTATVDALKAAEQTREAAAAASYVSKIKAEACKAGSPIALEEIEQVEKQFAAGNHELAKTLGGAFLGRSKALGAGAVGGDAPQNIQLGVNDESQKQLDASLARTRARWGVQTQEA